MTAALAELVDAAVRGRARELRELVRLEVDRALERLVDELVAPDLVAGTDAAEDAGLNPVRAGGRPAELYRAGDAWARGGPIHRLQREARR